MLLVSKELETSKFPGLSLLQLICLSVGTQGSEGVCEFIGTLRSVLVGQQIPLLMPAPGRRNFGEEVLSLEFQQPL